jgi:hypothetical protein
VEVNKKLAECSPEIVEVCVQKLLEFSRQAKVKKMSGLTKKVGGLALNLHTPPKFTCCTFLHLVNCKSFLEIHQMPEI